MPEDFASVVPGQQGWLGSKESEKRFFGEFANNQPLLCTRRDPRQVLNEKLLAETKEIQKRNGIDHGFCFLFLCEAIFGQQLQWLEQLIGSCVASGAMRTASYRMLAEVFLLNDPEILPGVDIEGTDAFAPFAPYSYRAGRKRGGINSGDGSYCSVHIEGQMEDGILFCNSGVQSDRYPEPQSTSLYRKWGNSDSLLNEWKSKAQVVKQLETEEVTDTGSIKELITEHYKPLNICSSWGFGPSHEHPTWRLANGDPVWIYKRSGSWAHNMSVVGCVQVSGDWFVVIENSWGMRAHKNGQYFVVPLDTVMASWIRQASCFSVGEIDLPDQLPPILR
jgi:hypothetical protein